MPLPATPSDVSIDQWRILYDLAAQVRALAPWTFMYDTMLFAVREPTTARVGFVSVMGRLGEHFAVGVYLGAEGLYGFARLAATGGDPEAADLLLELPHVQLSFEDRAAVRPDDKAVMDRLGLKFRGRNVGRLPSARGAFTARDPAKLLAAVVKDRRRPGLTPRAGMG